MRRRWIDTSKDYIWICALVSLHHIYSGSDLFAIPALLSSAAFDWPVSVWVGGAVRGKKFALFYPIKTFSNVKSIRGKQKYFSIPIEWILKQPENEISPISHTFRTGAAVSGHPVSTHTPTMANEQEQQQWQSGTFHCRWPLLLIIMVGALWTIHRYADISLVDTRYDKMVFLAGLCPPVILRLIVDPAVGKRSDQNHYHVWL